MIGRVAILGLGARGSRWAEACLSAGWEVTGFDPDDRTGQEIDGGAAWQRATTISEAVKNAEMVICCLPERLELLRPVVQRAQASGPKTALVAVVSSAFDVDDVQGCAIRPGYVMRVAEDDAGGLSLDVGPRTGPDTRDQAKEALAVLGAAQAVAAPKGDPEPADDRRKA